jgi:hypothetical protein
MNEKLGDGQCKMKIFMDRAAINLHYIHVQLGHDIGHLCDQLMSSFPSFIGWVSFSFQKHLIYSHHLSKIQSQLETFFKCSSLFENNLMSFLYGRTCYFGNKKEQK